MPLLIEILGDPVNVSNVLYDTLLTSCAFLTALSFRELLIAIIDILAPSIAKRKIVYLLFVSVFILLLTIIVAVSFKTRSKNRSK